MIRLLWLGVNVLILDEPTTGITEEQRDQLFSALRTLAGEGLIVLFVSHKLEEVADLCERVTVLRHGSVAGHTELPAPPRQLVEMMFGRSVEPPSRERVALGDVTLDIDRALNSPRTGRAPVRSASRCAEGRRSGWLAWRGADNGSCCGPAPAGCSRPRGSIHFEGADPETRSDEIHYVPAGRLEEGLIPGLSVTEHLELTAPNDSFTIDWGASEERADSIIASYQIRGRPGTLADVLSGGNQQTADAGDGPGEGPGSSCSSSPPVASTSSRPVGSGRNSTEGDGEGATVVFTSSDLDELVAQSDRIAVFFAGEVVGVVDHRHRHHLRVGPPHRWAGAGVSS